MKAITDLINAFVAENGQTFTEKEVLYALISAVAVGAFLITATSF